MKLCPFIIPLFLLSSVIFAQDKTANSNFAEDRIDSSSAKYNSKQLPPRTLIIKMKDIKQIGSLRDNQFIIVDDTARYSAEELSSGLSEKELEAYRSNKEIIKELIIPPPSEENTYPAVSVIRKILGIAKNAAVILILIVSLL
ncbi:MAG: hypothetical protein CVV24_06915 [Ignavibacteriae bacterium HGW-Ignavibacteriae-3]|nr:MAG: hypothetical protein CVV24_06915 [Ignavibacteriae bacterium HGW-Ignavibacteriae-3]